MASITIHQNPEEYRSAYGPNHWLVSSTDSSQDEFKYFADVFTGATSETGYLGRVFFPKYPVHAKGLLNVSGLVRTYIDHEQDLVPLAIGFSGAPHYCTTYRPLFGVQYGVFNFTDNFYSTGGRVGFTSTTAVHDFVVGDRLIIAQDTPFTNSSYEGVHTVYDVIDEHSFTLDVFFGASGPAEPGKARRNDGTPIRFSGVTTGQTRYVTGWTHKREDATESLNLGFFYIEDGTLVPKEILTNAPYGMRVSRNAQAFIPVVNNVYANRMSVYTYTSSNTLLGAYQIDSTTVGNGIPFNYVGVGPLNLTGSSFTAITGPAQIINSSAATYGIKIEGQTVGATSYQLNFKLDDRCSRFDEFTVLFLDRLGAWMPWTFILKHDERHIVKRQTYGRGDFGEVVGDSVLYKDQARGSSVYTQENLREFIVRTEWMTDDESNYFLELMTSPNAFWIKEADKFIPIVLDDGTFERIQEVNTDGQIRYELKFALAYRDSSNV